MFVQCLKTEKKKSCKTVLRKRWKLASIVMCRLIC